MLLRLCKFLCAGMNFDYQPLRKVTAAQFQLINIVKTIIKTLIKPFQEVQNCLNMFRMVQTVSKNIDIE